MQVQEALTIIRSLADGVDPVGGGPLPEEALLQRPPIVRALYRATSALEDAAERERRRSLLPDRVGQPWSDDEDSELIAAFEAGDGVAALAISHQRAPAAINARLEKLGLQPPVIDRERRKGATYTLEALAEILVEHAAETAALQSNRAKPQNRRYL